jgi:hypothetical protein
MVEARSQVADPPGGIPSQREVRVASVAHSDFSRVIIACMANGQIILVTTEPLSGGPPTRTVYYVAEENPAKAESLVGALMAPNEKVEALGSLPEAAVKALGLKPGEFIRS